VDLLKWLMKSGSLVKRRQIRHPTEVGAALINIVSSVNGLQAMVQRIASATEQMSSVSEQIRSDIETIATVSRELKNIRHYSETRKYL